MLRVAKLYFWSKEVPKHWDKYSKEKGKRKFTGKRKSWSDISSVSFCIYLKLQNKRPI